MCPTNIGIQLKFLSCNSVQKREKHYGIIILALWIYCWEGRTSILTKCGEPTPPLRMLPVVWSFPGLASVSRFYACFSSTVHFLRVPGLWSMCLHWYPAPSPSRDQVSWQSGSGSVLGHRHETRWLAISIHRDDRTPQKHTPLDLHWRHSEDNFSLAKSPKKVFIATVTPLKTRGKVTEGTLAWEETAFSTSYGSNMSFFFSNCTKICDDEKIVLGPSWDLNHKLPLLWEGAENMD